MNPPDEIGVEETGGSGAPAPEKFFLPPRAASGALAVMARLAWHALAARTARRSRRSDTCTPA